MIEIKTLTMIINKNSSGYVGGKVSIPNKWLRDMGITQDDRKIKVTYTNGTITIEKL